MLNVETVTLTDGRIRLDPLSMAHVDALRRDGTVRDTVMYSLAAGEWPEVRAHLQHQVNKPR